MASRALWNYVHICEMKNESSAHCRANWIEQLCLLSFLFLVFIFVFLLFLFHFLLLLCCLSPDGTQTILLTWSSCALGPARADTKRSHSISMRLLINSELHMLCSLLGIVNRRRWSCVQLYLAAAAAPRSERRTQRQTSLKTNRWSHSWAPCGSLLLVARLLGAVVVISWK